LKAHVGAPATLYVPGGQGRQAAGDTAPTAVEKVPAAQQAQNAAPPAAPYVPAAHCVQFVAPAALKAPAAQGAHTPPLLAPRTLEEVPGGQVKYCVEVQ
jgi:hypothetical protein